MGTTLDNIKAIILNDMGVYLVLLMKPWPPSGYALDVMVIMCSMAFELGWLHKHKNILPLISSVSIV